MTHTTTSVVGIDVSTSNQPTGKWPANRVWTNQEPWFELLFFFCRLLSVVLDTWNLLWFIKKQTAKPGKLRCSCYYKTTLLYYAAYHFRKAWMVLNVRQVLENEKLFQNFFILSSTDRQQLNSKLLLYCSKDSWHLIDVWFHWSRRANTSKFYLNGFL